MTGVQTCALPIFNYPLTLDFFSYFYGKDYKDFLNYTKSLVYWIGILVLITVLMFFIAIFTMLFRKVF